MLCSYVSDTFPDGADKFETMVPVKHITFQSEVSTLCSGLPWLEEVADLLASVVR